MSWANSPFEMNFLLLRSFRYSALAGSSAASISCHCFELLPGVLTPVCLPENGHVTVFRRAGRPQGCRWLRRPSGRASAPSSRAAALRSPGRLAVVASPDFLVIHGWFLHWRRHLESGSLSVMTTSGSMTEMPSTAPSRKPDVWPEVDASDVDDRHGMELAPLGKAAGASEHAAAGEHRQQHCLCDPLLPG